MNTENPQKTKKCSSCKQEISLNTTKCPYCGKEASSLFKRHPILTFLIALFVLSQILFGLLAKSDKSGISTQKSPPVVANPTSLQNDDLEIEPIYNTKVITGKTVAEMEKILGEPSSHVKPLGEMYGELVWEKNGINVDTSYLDRNKITSSFSFQFPGIKLSFSPNDFEKAFRLIGLELTRNQFENTSPIGFTRYTANNLAGFKKITVQSTIEDKENIKLIWFIQKCEPELLCR